VKRDEGHEQKTKSQGKQQKQQKQQNTSTKSHKMPYTQHGKSASGQATTSENFFVTSLAALSSIAVGSLYFPTPIPVTDYNPMAALSPTTTSVHPPTHLTPTRASSSEASEKSPASHAHYNLHLGQISHMGDAFHRHHHGHLVEEVYGRS
jgi:hypothetical protein